AIGDGSTGRAREIDEEGLVCLDRSFTANLDGNCFRSFARIEGQQPADDICIIRTRGATVSFAIGSPASGVVNDSHSMKTGGGKSYSEGGWSLSAVALDHRYVVDRNRRSIVVENCVSVGRCRTQRSVAWIRQANHDSFVGLVHGVIHHRDGDVLA